MKRVVAQYGHAHPKPTRNLATEERAKLLERPQTSLLTNFDEKIVSPWHRKVKSTFFALLIKERY